MTAPLPTLMAAAELLLLLALYWAARMACCGEEEAVVEVDAGEQTDEGIGETTARVGDAVTDADSK